MPDRCEVNAILWVLKGAKKTGVELGIKGKNISDSRCDFGLLMNLLATIFLTDKHRGEGRFSQLARISFLEQGEEEEVCSRANEIPMELLGIANRLCGKTAGSSADCFSSCFWTVLTNCLFNRGTRCGWRCLVVVFPIKFPSVPTTHVFNTLAQPGRWSSSGEERERVSASAAYVVSFWQFDLRLRLA